MSTSRPFVVKASITVSRKIAARAHSEDNISTTFIVEANDLTRAISDGLSSIEAYRMLDPDYEINSFTVIPHEG